MVKRSMVTKNICIITTVDITLKQFVIPSAREMQKNGFAVTFVSSMSKEFVGEFSNEFTLINIPFERGAKPLGMLKGIIQLYKLFRKNKYDLIQYATPNAAFYASIAGKLAGVCNRLYCQWGIRYVGFDGFARKLFRRIEKITCSLSTQIRPASYKNMKFAISEGLYQQSKASVVGAGGAVGIDLGVFDILEKEEYRKEIFERHPELKDKTVFGFVGRLARDKGVNELIRAFLKYYSEDSNSALVIVGPKEDNGELEAELVKQCEACQDILFTGFSNEVKKYISAFTIHVHPSYREGFSLVIQQAMSMGVPVITTDIPGPSEVIVDGVSGMLVPAKNSKALYLAMKNLSLDKEKQKLFAENGLERVKMLFTQERMSQLIVEDRQQICEL
ncbi:glycosyltransferase family 4 protein [Marinifilum sp. D714]|uniref:glycosyltransferase family 4 protein n=1 Tax=Marinifilum sp. D714 TaxID=2937523 RepID=UPI0027CC3935|nr:glycosyltransferase family 4 protein [Marinifilum sp. D714]MDQ2178544.1 glycosyltransferase family 4 protein [Marinifilum sp. D714]